MCHDGVMCAGGFHDPSDVYGSVSYKENIRMSVGFFDPNEPTDNIYGHDLEIGSEFLISTNPAEQWDPAVDENIVVWRDKRHKNWDVYGYDLAIKAEFPISADAAEQWHPSISGDTVVWMDKRNGNWDIYGAKLSRKE